MTASRGAAEMDELACPSCDHPWSAHGRDGCAYADPGGCWCGNTEAATLPANTRPRGTDMGHSPDAYLFYGYTLSDDFELPDSAFLRDGEPVRIGYYGYESSTPYVEITSTAAWASGHGSKKVDLLGLIAALPDDADDQIRAFAAEHGLPQPGERIDPDSEYDDETASEVGWWLAAQYG